jgi:hypothetical protein
LNNRGLWRRFGCPVIGCNNRAIKTDLALLFSQLAGYPEQAMLTGPADRTKLASWSASAGFWQQLKTGKPGAAGQEKLC